MSTRQERERDFHNHIFDSGERHVTDKYYAITNPSKGLYRQWIQEVSSNSNVLEYGCGPGSEAFSLAARGIKVTGIDISDVAIQQAQEQAAAMGVAHNTTFSVMDAEQLDFPNASFDVVCGSGILHHLDLDKSLSEIARVLRPGGKGIFFEPLGHNPLINLYRTLTPRLRTEDEHPLKMKDFEIMRRYFSSIDAHFFHITSIGTVAFRNSRSFETLRQIFESFDQFLFKNIPIMRKYAWMSVMTLENP